MGRTVNIITGHDQARKTDLAQWAAMTREERRAVGAEQHALWVRNYHPVLTDWIELCKLFSAHRVWFLLIGGQAVIAHGYPRLTRDMDLWVRPTTENGEKLLAGITIPLISKADLIKNKKAVCRLQDLANVEYAETLRKLGPTERLRSAERLYWSARRLKEDAIRARHPNWTESQVSDATRAAFLKARWAEVYESTSTAVAAPPGRWLGKRKQFDVIEYLKRSLRKQLGRANLLTATLCIYRPKGSRNK